MVKNFVSEVYGIIEYEEGFWTGKKTLKLNGVKLHSTNKTSYTFEHEEKIVMAMVVGNIYKGSILHIGNEKYEIYPKSKWYEFILAILPFILIIVWGNSVELCSVVPVVGGAIGGGISGVFGVLSLLLMKSNKNPLIKILIGLGLFVVTFLVCAVIGYAILGVLSQ